jgi:biotin carboxyl carrier protein
MEFEFRFDDKTYSVVIERRNNPAQQADSYNATIDGIAHDVSVSRISPNLLILFLERQKHRVYIVRADDRLYVHIAGKVITLDLATADNKTFSKDLLEFGSKDQVSTPMPGKVVKILVKEGERVQLKQSLVIVESMKMENEIKSPTDGIVKSIHFSPGDLVETGQPIIKIQPD